ncbi:MAG TPA: transglycosylase SLT domain-containing protein [Actinomycetota bacterium]|nr:transglycosylase SLT domain-containing protein [Actinomycetota bacterium]
MAPAVGASAKPLTKGVVRERDVLRARVVRLFDRLDQVGLVIERVRADMAWVEDRISDLSRQIEARQRLLNRRAAEAYMAGRAGAIDSVLGASSLTDLEDALEFLDAVSQQDSDVILSLRRRQAEVEIQRARLEALEEELRGTRERLETTASDLVDQLRRQRELSRPEIRETAPDGSVGSASDPSPLPGPIGPSPPPGPEVVTALIRDRFASLGPRTTRAALCVAEAESGLDPLVMNPATGAAGVFQFLPATWESLSELAGRGAASAFDARANVAVAAWTVAHYGWHPWRSIAAECGV